MKEDFSVASMIVSYSHIPRSRGSTFPYSTWPGNEARGGNRCVHTWHEHEQVQFLISAKAEILKLFHWGMVTVE